MSGVLSQTKLHWLYVLLSIQERTLLSTDRNEATIVIQELVVVDNMAGCASVAGGGR